MAVYKVDKTTGKVIEIGRRVSELSGEKFAPFYSEDFECEVTSQRHFDNLCKAKGLVRTQERFSRLDMIRQLEKGKSGNPDFLKQRDKLLKRW